MAIEFINGEHWSIRVGDVFAGLATVADKSVHAVVTSPPYWMLRDYGYEGQIGQEPTPEAFVETMVRVFAEVKRVLRDDGVLFVNLGDTFSATRSYQVTDSKHVAVGNSMPMKAPEGIPASNLVGIPWRVALALQAGGWILRRDLIWAKPSPMPESIAGWRWVKCKVKTAPRPYRPQPFDGDNERQSNVGESACATYEPCPGCDKCRDNNGMILRKGSWRATTSHEYIFQFVKSQSYFCDGDGSKEPASCAGRKPRIGTEVYAGVKGLSKDRRDGGHIDRVVETRNQRSVWRVSSESYKEAHFATYPTELVRRCLIAATSRGGCCSACGMQYAPVVESKRTATRPGTNTKCDYSALKDMNDTLSYGNRDPQRHTTTTVVTGYLPSCKCGAEPARPVVLDPFGGSMTTGQVAINMGCEFIGLEGSTEYAPLGVKRLNTKWVPVSDRKKQPAKKRRPTPKQQELFRD